METTTKTTEMNEMRVESEFFVTARQNALKGTSKIEVNRRRDAFESTMENLNAFGYDKNGKVIMSSGNIKLSLMYVDERYQGFRKHEKINKLINKWDVRKLTPVILVPHPEECRFAIVDGQGRYTVAPLKKMDKLQAIILMDAPTEYDERLKFESSYFISQDGESEKIKPLEKHPALVINGDRAALLLEDMIEKYDISFNDKQGTKGKRIVGSYTDTYNIAKTHGRKCLEFIFSIIENCGWNIEANGYSTYVMRALKNIWIAHPSERNKIHKFLSKNLRKITPTIFSSNGKSKYPNRDFRTACTLYLEDVVCDELNIERHIYVDGDKRCKIV